MNRVALVEVDQATWRAAGFAGEKPKHPRPTLNATFSYTEKYMLRRLARGKFQLLKR